MDLKQHCLYAAQKLMLLIAKNWDTVVSKMSSGVDIIMSILT